MSYFKKRCYEILILDLPGDVVGKIIDGSLLVLIILNVLAVMVGTVEEITVSYGRALYIFEIFSVVIFTIEYLLRIWCCTLDERFSGPLTGRIRFFFQAMTLIDLAAILPFYLPMLVTLDTRFLRALRLFRLFRVLKVGRYSNSVRLLGLVLSKKREELVVSFSAVMVILIIISSVMFFLEHDSQPDKFSSIPATMWWGVACLTTVGYGDVFPVTVMGRILGALAAVVGLALFALPTGIIAAAFYEELESHKNQSQGTCPHCGKEIQL
ncbi:MAG: ion transporter [Acidobacteriota bacterium]